MKKQIISMLLALCVCSGFLLSSSGAQAAAKPQYGITVDANGTMKMNGKPFYAYGVNEYTMMYGFHSDPFSNPLYKTNFATIKKYNIPFVRLPLLKSSVSYYQEYLKDPESAFKIADVVFAEAEKQHVGVIVSIFFDWGNLASAMGEKLSAMGDVNSKTMKLVKQFTKDTVKRYVNRPFVWGWEVANECNLTADIFSTEHWDAVGPLVGEFNGYDSTTSEEMMVFMREIAKSIREVDSYRMISTGAALQRQSAYSLYKSSQKMTAAHTWNMDWGQDTVEEFRYMAKYLTPNPINVFSMHCGTPELSYTYQLKDTTLSYGDLLKEYISTAKTEKKGFYFGEFGDMGVLDELDDTTVKTLFPKNLKTMVASGVQLASLWQFNGNNSIFNDEGKMGYILQELSKINDQFKKSGLQDTTGAWPSSTNSNSSSTTARSSRLSSSGAASVQTSGSPTDLETSTSQSSSTDVDNYMRSSSTHLSISDVDNSITITKPVSIDTFRKSVTLRDGYTMSIFDNNGVLVTEEDAIVDHSCTVAVYDQDGVEVRQFAIVCNVDSASTVSDSSQEASQTEPEQSGSSIWVVWLIVILAVVVLGGGFIAGYFILRNKRGSQK